VRFGALFLVYIVVGLLVAGGVLGDERNYFSDIDNLEEIVEMLLAILLWPLVLLDVAVNLGEGGGDTGGGSDSGSGGESSGGDSGKSDK